MMTMKTVEMMISDVATSESGDGGCRLAFFLDRTSFLCYVAFSIKFNRASSIWRRTHSRSQDPALVMGNRTRVHSCT